MELWKVEFDAVFFLPIIFGALSLMGSTTIVTILLRKKYKRLSSVYERLILGMSCTDILSSTAVIFSVLPTPAGTFDVSGMRFGYGTTTTCDIQGFFFHAGQMGTTLYYGALATYYVLEVSTNTPKKVVKTQIEPFLHAIPILYPITTGIFLAVTQEFNNAFTICWIAAYPFECRYNPNVECERGKNFILYRWIFVNIPIVIVFFVVVICMITLICTVVRQENKIRKYDFYNNRSASTRAKRHSFQIIPQSWQQQRSGSIGATSTGSINNSQRKRVKETFKQAMFYISAYLMTFIFATIMAIMLVSTGRFPHLLLLLQQMTAFSRVSLTFWCTCDPL